MDAVEVRVVCADNVVAFHIVNAALFLGQFLEQDHFVGSFEAFAADLGKIGLQRFVLGVLLVFQHLLLVIVLRHADHLFPFLFQLLVFFFQLFFFFLQVKLLLVLVLVFFLLIHFKKLAKRVDIRQFFVPLLLPLFDALLFLFLLSKVHADAQQVVFCRRNPGLFVRRYQRLRRVLPLASLVPDPLTFCVNFGGGIVQLRNFVLLRFLLLVLDVLQLGLDSFITLEEVQFLRSS